MTPRWLLEEDLKYETAALQSATADIPTHHIHRMRFYRAQTLFELQRYVEAVKDYRVVVLDVPMAGHRGQTILSNFGHFDIILLAHGCS